MALSAEIFAPLAIAQSNLPHLFTELISPFVGKLPARCL
jgi:hypothetical protein